MDQARKFRYPIRQRWFASQTWFSNEAVSARPSERFYYHSGLDLGATELLEPVFAATDGRVVSVGGQTAADVPRAQSNPRYDVVCIQDRRGWYYRYSHLSAINTPVQLGAEVHIGQRIGTVGKEGNSGGWSHLHFEIKSLQPSGQWGTQDGYAFLWQANRQQHDPPIIAVARPRHLAVTGETVTLDGRDHGAVTGSRISNGHLATARRHRAHASIEATIVPAPTASD